MKINFHWTICLSVESISGIRDGCGLLSRPTSVKAETAVWFLNQKRRIDVFHSYPYVFRTFKHSNIFELVRFLLKGVELVLWVLRYSSFPLGSLYRTHVHFSLMGSDCTIVAFGVEQYPTTSSNLLRRFLNSAFWLSRSMLSGSTWTRSEWRLWDMVTSDFGV